MQRQVVKPMSVGAPRAVPSPGPGSLVGPSGAAPKPRLKNTRDYGKKLPQATPGMGPSPNPFGPTEGGSRLGGI